ncbi:hypothetical protein SI859A1_01349 [Aurantimonas manganoxydans SI85-9A1]|uniref:Uncharacterized protein n=1 Tax=Aurantimonas manganoxydans (strain ATCC BAA-1229 / DSM 21871 / SI85-9A1) TaxID=287752 RepID=Q1YIX1_AURMS|nr:hypothetical protein SI859A1_01349 [Aurantimonas manganoxydans SI85-9A1]
MTTGVGGDPSRSDRSTLVGWARRLSLSMPWPIPREAERLSRDPRGACCRLARAEDPNSASRKTPSRGGIPRCERVVGFYLVSGQGGGGFFSKCLRFCGPFDRRSNGRCSIRSHI